MNDKNKGEFHPWVWTCEKINDVRGEFFYKHPDGRKTRETSFILGDDEQRRRAYKIADDFVRTAIKADAKPKRKEYKLNDQLASGATVINHTRDLVLAALTCKGNVIEYAVWTIDDRGRTLWGHYSPSFEEIILYYHQKLQAK